jgi:hypothetical protein
MPTATLSSNQATEAACEKVSYTVNQNDTLSAIAGRYRVTIESIKSYNGLNSDTVYQGQALIIPLCQRLPTAGPTPTATLPPPYAAPNLLLPADGGVFMVSNDSIVLQWSAVGSLRPSESYAVTLEDVTDGTGRKMTEYVSETKYIVPSSFRPTGTTPHIMRWTVMVVRQVGTTKDGKQVWDSAGSAATPRVFSWWGSPSTNTTPQP